MRLNNCNGILPLCLLVIRTSAVVGSTSGLAKSSCKWKNKEMARPPLLSILGNIAARNIIRVTVKRPWWKYCKEKKVWRVEKNGGTSSSALHFHQWIDFPIFAVFSYIYNLEVVLTFKDSEGSRSVLGNTNCFHIHIDF